MNQLAAPRIARSVCPHDCPSTCALDVEIIDENTIGRVRVLTHPKPQLICESWGASGTLLHSMTIDAQT